LEVVIWNERLCLATKEVTAQIGNLLAGFCETSILHLRDPRCIVQRITTRGGYLIDPPDCLSMMTLPVIILAVPIALWDCPAMNSRVREEAIGSFPFHRGGATTFSPF
jgi:hypothetical protein